MKTKVLLFSLFTVTLFALGATVTLLFNTSPETREVIWLFYTAYLLSVFGIVFFLLFIWNAIKFHATPPWQTTFSCVRYSLLFAILTSLLLILNANNVLSLPTGLVITAGLIIAELVWRRKAALV